MLKLLSTLQKYMFDTQMSGVVHNNGHDVTFHVLHSGNSRWPESVNVSGGPLSYTYRLDRVKFHFGLHNGHGSEHTIASRAFPVEVS